MSEGRAALGIEAAACHVAAGGLIAFPTETVWGLGADATSPEAMARLRAWKGRDADQPVSILVAGLEDLSSLGFDPAPWVRALAERFWPGPLTLLLPASSLPLPAAASKLAAGVARADGAVGLRCSSHPTAAGLARALAQTGAGPLTATSLNRRGASPARSEAEAREICRTHPGPERVEPLDAVDGVGPGGEQPVSCAAPSTVVDCTGPAYRVVREGAISAAALAEAAAAKPFDGPPGASTRP